MTKKATAKVTIEVVDGKLNMKSNVPPFQLILLLSESINSVTRQSIEEASTPTEDEPALD